MNARFAPVEKTNLADDLARRIVEMIRSGIYKAGDRMPAIMEMARHFGVGHPTLREALKKLEVMGVVQIRHGAGVYVGQSQDAILVSNPIYAGSVSKKLMLDLIEARIPIEMKSAVLAASHASQGHLDRMAQLLEEAARNFDDDVALSAANMAFHREIAAASGNVVLAQLQEVLTNLFQREQRAILDVYVSREKDHAEHRGLYDALARRDAALAGIRMQGHLEGVRAALLRWDPERDPVR